MLALLGDGDARRARRPRRPTVTLANDNGPTQIVVAGPREALAAAEAEAKARRPAHDPARGPRRLPHRRRWSRRSAVPRGARARSFGLPPAPVFSSVAAGLFDDDRSGFATSSRPRSCGRCAGARRVDALYATGVRSFAETGPGKVLTRMVRRSLRRRRGAAAGRAGGGPCLSSLDPDRRRPTSTATGNGARPWRRRCRHRGGHRRARRAWSATARSPRGSASTENWIVARTGVRERRVAAPERAARRLRRRGRPSARSPRPGSTPLSVDLVLVATMSHERPDAERRRRWSPSASARRRPARSTSAPPARASSAALALAAGQIESGRARHVLVVGADLLSRITDPDDRSDRGAVRRRRRARSSSAPALARRAIGPAVLGVRRLPRRT